MMNDIVQIFVFVCHRGILTLTASQT